MNDAWNHALLVISVFISWSIAVWYIGASKIFWDYEAFEDTSK